MDAKAESKEDELFRSVVAWLVSLRIPRQDAREYASALREFGFDDMQSLQEVGGTGGCQKEREGHRKTTVLQEWNTCQQQFPQWKDRESPTSSTLVN